MKLIIVAALALVAIVVAAPTEEPVQIVEDSRDQKPDGSFDFHFATSDGTNRKETGEVKEVLNEKNETVKVVVVRGSYTYTDDQGHEQTITYVADESGFSAQGDSIPQVPEPSS